MSFLDTIRLALGNLGQAKLRTLLTVAGVSIGIAALSGLVSFGVGLEDQFVGSFKQSGMFDSITVTSAPVFRAGGFGGRGRGNGNNGRGGRAAANAGRSDTDTGATTPSETPRPKLDDDAIAKITALANVSGVQPNLRVPMQVTYKDFTEFTAAAGVAMSSGGEGAFQTIAHGRFFANEQDDACMLSLDMAKRLSTADPKDLIGQAVTLTYATAPAKDAPAPTAIPGVPPSMQVQRVETLCPIVGIVERESAPGMMGGGAVSPLMIPLAKAKAIDAVQVTSAQSLLRAAEPKAYQSITVRVSGSQHTQDIEDKIKSMGYSAFSMNDLLQGAKRAFILLDIFLSLFGSIALTVSSLMIVNTMVMSILERTREIGIMKAIGGSDGDIRRIFLIEASAIGVLGGIAGVVLGWVVGRVINFGVNIYIVNQGGKAGNLFSLPLWLVGSAIGFSILVSLIAGSYPARRAARLDPIQALRHD
jgi:putative ABC transport system permease protein